MCWFLGTTHSDPFFSRPPSTSLVLVFYPFFLLKLPCSGEPFITSSVWKSPVLSILRKGNVFALFSSQLSPYGAPSPCLHEGHQYLVQVLSLFFSLQHLISFLKYMKQSDWHPSYLCTFLLYPGEEVCTKKYLGFEPVYFKLDFLNTGPLHVTSPPQTLPDHLFTFNLAWQKDKGLEDKVL